MSERDLKPSLFYTPSEIATIFRHEGDLTWVYRAASQGFLKPYARRFGRMLLFNKKAIDDLVGEDGAPLP